MFWQCHLARRYGRGHSGPGRADTGLGRGHIEGVHVYLGTSPLPWHERCAQPLGSEEAGSPSGDDEGDSVMKGLRAGSLPSRPRLLVCPRSRIDARRPNMLHASPSLSNPLPITLHRRSTPALDKMERCSVAGKQLRASRYCLSHVSQALEWPVARHSRCAKADGQSRPALTAFPARGILEKDSNITRASARAGALPLFSWGLVNPCLAPPHCSG